MSRPLLLLVALALATGLRARPATVGTARNPPDAVQIDPDLRVVRLADGVWMHTSWSVLAGGVRFPANGLLVRDGSHLVLIDTAWGEQPTRDLLDWIDRELKLPVACAVVTHAHDDRMGGAAVLATRGTPCWSHPLTGPLAAKHGWPQPRPLRGLAVPGSSATLGSIEVFYPGIWAKGI